MAKKVLTLVIVLIVAVPLLHAQVHPEQTSPYKPSKMGIQPRGFLESLLNPEKFSMSHSYSVSMFSLGGQTFSQGLYLNTMNYKFSDPLTMQVRIGYVHQPFGGLNQNAAVGGQLFVQRAMLQYKPSKNTTFSIDFQQVPSSMLSPYYYRPGGFYSRQKK
jgi:hypothetical protein